MGSGEPPLGMCPSSSRHDMRGATVLPGLQDAHIHCLDLGKTLRSLRCHGSSSIPDLQSRLGRWAESHGSAGDWIVGYGWEQDRLKRFPTRSSGGGAAFRRDDGDAIL